jgi:hypothetical protein
MVGIALATLETAAIRVMQDFQPLQTANTLHIMAQQQYKTCLLPELERAAEAISGEFNSQEVANMWAYATMGEKPGEVLMGQLEWRAEEISEEFNSQAIANMLWAFATIVVRWGQSRGS